MYLFHPQLFVTYIAVCETGSFTKAAKRMCLSQSTISQQISRFENRFDSKLLVRTTHSVQLTEDGEKVLQHAYDILDLNIKVNGCMLSKPNQTLIRIGIPCDLAVATTSHIAEFKRQHSDIRVDITTGLSLDIYRKYQAGSLDIILVKQQVVGDAFAKRPEPLLWLDSAKYPTFNQDVIPLVLFPVGALYRDHIFKSIGSMGYRYVETYTSANLSALAAATAAGFGITLLPETCKNDEHIIINELQNFALPDDFSLALYISNSHDLLQKTLADSLVEKFNLVLLQPAPE